MRHNAVLSALTVLIAALTLACGGQGGGAQPSPDAVAETLAFIRDGDIWLIGADGSNERRLTNLGNVQSFSWLSPGELYVLAGEDASSRLLIDSEGNVHEVALPLATPVDAGPYDVVAEGSWSRDGRQYVVALGQAIVGFDRDGRELFRVEMTPPPEDPDFFCRDAPVKKGSSSRGGAGAKLILGLPVFSPDGKTVVVAVHCPFTDAPNQWARLYRVSVESRAIQPMDLFANLRYLQAPRFSPDGSRIAQRSSDQIGTCPPETFLSVADLEDQTTGDVFRGPAGNVTLPAIEELRHKQTTGYVFGGPAGYDRPAGYDWSPDGGALAVSFEVGVCDWNAATPIQPFLSGLYILKLDGSSEEKLVDGPTQSPAWSPSGRYVAYVKVSPGRNLETAGLSTIRLFDLRSRRSADLTQGSGPAWQPRE